MWEFGGGADALGLQEVTALVGGDCFETGADGETQTRDEGIPEANAIDIFNARGDKKIANRLVT